ncbi:MATE family efflux transporter [Bacteroides pyogenes]|uniref:MATE family efflux transporter n=1 Tax=Bacteroides pyogenes TaxID=310300 RepID=UPI002A83DD2E|nr:MATE family efflux transporter [Bacteroides pyogenes]MDY4248812.1 MATE family efflux transporter [Bacteroides pyogenes]
MINSYRTYKSHYKALFFLGLPIVIGQVGVIVLGFADTLMIGHHSTLELGAASFVNNVFNLAIIFSTGFSYGLTPIVGGLYGTRQFPPAGQALRCSLLANFLVAVLLTLIMGVLWLNVENLGQPEELIPLIKPYYLVLLASLVFVMLFNGFKQFTDGITDTKTAMWILLGGNVLNIIGNYLLIYGKLGFPELGLLGAGISTLFSRIMMVVVFVAVFARSPRFLRYKIGFFRLGWSRSVLRRLNALGWPIGLQMGMEAASFSLSTVMIGWLGTIALASHQIMLTISQFTFMMYYGMGAAVAVRVSNFKGQNDMVNVRRSAYAGFHLMMALGFILSSIVFFCRNYLGSWFTDSAQVAGMVTSLVFPFLIYQFGDGLQITFANALRGISDVKPMMFIAFIAYFLISLPVGYFCGFTLGWGIIGVWMAFPFGLTSAGLMLWLRFRQQIKLRPLT